jgi:2-polyprenyl-3-methyl-5-hydroxy-6-metoxy-1,4-benzoquinol methylase
MKPVMKAIRTEYKEHGVAAYYQQYGDSYLNPHEAAIHTVVTHAVSTWQLPTERVLDLACGSGEVTLALAKLGVTNVIGADPYTGNAYKARTQQDALIHSFEDIAQGALDNERFSLVVCSYAMHLVAVSWLPLLLHHLAVVSNNLLIISPHKRPVIKPTWGWTLHESVTLNRVHGRWYGV